MSTFCGKPVANVRFNSSVINILLFIIIVGYTSSLLHSSKNFASLKEAAPLQYFDLLFNYWQKHNFAFEAANGKDQRLNSASILAILLKLINVDYEKRGPKNCLIWNGRDNGAGERPYLQWRQKKFVYVD